MDSILIGKSYRGAWRRLREDARVRAIADREERAKREADALEDAKKHVMRILDGASTSLDKWDRDVDEEGKTTFSIQINRSAFPPMEDPTFSDLMDYINGTDEIPDAISCESIDDGRGFLLHLDYTKKQPDDWGRIADALDHSARPLLTAEDVQTFARDVLDVVPPIDWIVATGLQRVNTSRSWDCIKNMEWRPKHSPRRSRTPPL